MALELMRVRIERTQFYLLCIHYTRIEINASRAHKLDDIIDYIWYIERYIVWMYLHIYAQRVMQSEEVHLRSLWWLKRAMKVAARRSAVESYIGGGAADARSKMLSQV